MKNLFANTLRLLRNKKVIIGIILLIIILFAWNSFFGGSKTPQYQTAQAQKGTLITSVSDSGSITSAGSVSLTTTSTGTVGTVYVQQGDQVTQGEKIADLVPDQASQQRQTQAWANYLSAQNALAADQAQLDTLQAAMFKANQTFVNDRGIANPTDQQKADPTYIQEDANWLAAEANYENQQGVIAKDQASQTSAWYAYEQTASQITAPAAGTVTNLALTSGLAITGTTSSTNNAPSTQTVGTITINSGQLQATVNASEIDVTQLKLGQRATLTLDAFPNKTFTGQVSAIDTTGVVSSGVTTYPVTITLDSTQNNIYPNMSVSARIITAVKDNVLTVPSTAVQTAGGQSTVRVLQNGQVTTVPVTVGDSNDTDTEITSGLNEGDSVVIGTISSGPSGATSSPFSTGGFGGGGFRVFNGGGGGGGARRGG
ncbi:MAG: efflux RND transporter periplasmic adaptor subunit [Patescibacteria group bacterium]|nr:efflux RND transporter periplasmic adaptor subunit [Patescibacteria group bacterium]MDE2589271.1 efflux RND transporter periplasmic adaptor subunit [Patescibacteria group bacterium]